MRIANFSRSERASLPSRSSKGLHHPIDKKRAARLSGPPFGFDSPVLLRIRRDQFGNGNSSCRLLGPSPLNQQLGILAGAVGPDEDRIGPDEGATEQVLGERIFEQVLDRPTQGP